MATITVNNSSLSGLIINDQLTAAAGGGDVFANDGKTYFVVNNGSGASINVTFTAQNTSVSKSGYGNVSITDTVVAVDAGDETIIGPFPTARFNNTSGQVSVSYSSATSVTVAAIRAGLAS